MTNTTATNDLSELKKSAEAGNADAQFKLAGCYLDGIGVKQDKAEFNKWALLAAKGGLRKAMYPVVDYFLWDNDIVNAFAWANAFNYSTGEVESKQIKVIRSNLERMINSINAMAKADKTKAVQLTREVTSKYCSGSIYSLASAGNFGVSL